MTWSLVLYRLLDVVLALAVPIAIGEALWFLVRRIGPQDFWRVPAVTTPAKLAGLLTGGVLLLSQYDPRLFDFHDLFGPASPWNLSLRAFLVDRVNPLNYDLGHLAAQVSAEGFSGVLAYGVAAVAALALCFVIASLYFFWQRFYGATAILSAVLLMLLAAFLPIYFVCFAFWALHMLNFWSLAILIVLFQYYRHRA